MPGRLNVPLRKLRLLLSEGSLDSLEAEEAMLAAAACLVSSESAPKELGGLDQAKASTREGVFRDLNRSRDYALSSIGSKLSLDELAGIACMSPFHFHRLHRQAFGETPHEFITRARLQRATRLLQAGKHVIDVSLAVGFESVPTFSRLFKSRLGMTPGAFRKIG
jgi:AraC family transcriptional regulator